MDTNKFEDIELLELAKKRVQRIKGFYTHLFIYVIGVTIYILKTYYGFPFNFFPIKYINWFVMGIWTVVIVADAIDLFFREIVFGKKWEQKKINDIIKKNSTNKNWE